ncbi:MAG: hypothetical protein AB7O38_24450 [Pirellulaceae bacterium]
MIKRLFVAVGMALLASTATADQYWIAYEGDELPEMEGWSRVFSDGGAERSVADGALVLDSRRSISIVDYYNWEQPLNPGPNELFVMEWSLRVDFVSAREDPNLGVFSDDFRAVGFEFSESYLIDAFHPNRRFEIEPHVFHSYRLQSADMRDYELWVDGIPALSGSFFGVFDNSRVTWGDGVQGSASLADWDYFRFGVIPEPSPGIALYSMIYLIRRSGMGR